MEVDESVFDINAHFEDDSIHFQALHSRVNTCLTYADPLSHSGREKIEEFWNVLWSHLDACISISQLAPSLLEIQEIVVKALKWVVNFQIKLRKLLNDD